MVRFSCLLLCAWLAAVAAQSSVLRHASAAGFTAKSRDSEHSCTSAAAGADASAWLCWQRHVRRVPHRSGSQPETHTTWPHQESAHARAGLGCESCHGPGQAHVDDDAKGHILKFAAMKPAEVSQTCLTCHARGAHAGWEGSTHEARNLSCTTCHSVHKPVSSERQLVKATEKEVCATCHKPQVIKTERAVAHMPVREGKMSCSSCHNPHGSISNVKALKVGSSIGESCTSCHAEMRGPVLWEHAPVRESCTTCHDPHGSSNDRMLNVRMPMLCQRCHVATRHPATIYDNNAITVNKSNRMFGRSCVNCHSNIHGSNHPSGQFFMR